MKKGITLIMKVLFISCILFVIYLMYNSSSVEKFKEDYDKYEEGIISPNDILFEFMFIVTIIFYFPLKIINSVMKSFDDVKESEE